MNGRVKAKDTTPVFDVRHICTYLLLTRVYVQEQYFWLVRCMVLEMDNKGAVDLANSWSVGGRTRHVDVRIHYVRELKEAGMLLIKWVPGPQNDADMHTKNVPNPLFENFGRVYFGEDEYYVASDTPEREGVGS